MKQVFAILMMFVSVNAFASQKEMAYETLGNPGDFAVISDLEVRSARVFLSYTGKRFDHCGVSIRSGNKVTAEQLNQVLQVSSPKADSAVIVDGRLVVTVPNPSSTTFGQDFIISTRSGRSLAQDLKGLSDYHKVDVIVEILGCK